MRRYTSSIGILLLTFLVSGWGNVLAATFCPHTMKAQAKTGTQPKRSCHSDSVGNESLHSVPSKDSMDGMEMTTSRSSESSEGSASAIDHPNGTCAHCFTTNEQSARRISAHALVLKGHDSRAVVETPLASTVELSTELTYRSRPTQHAPPGSQSRTYLLLNVFLI